MPLLRLVQQISSMYQNVKDTQLEIKEQEAHIVHVVNQQPNGSSSASDVQEHLSSITDQGHSKTIVPSVTTTHTSLFGNQLDTAQGTVILT